MKKNLIPLNFFFSIILMITGCKLNYKLSEPPIHFEGNRVIKTYNMGTSPLILKDVAINKCFGSTHIKAKVFFSDSISPLPLINLVRLKNDSVIVSNNQFISNNSLVKLNMKNLEKNERLFLYVEGLTVKELLIK